MSRCAYCHRDIEIPHTASQPDGEPLPCCSEDCIERLDAFYGFFEHTKILFFAGIVLSILLLLVSAFLLLLRHMLPGSILFGSSLSLLGLIVTIFPFATPQTFAMLGVRRTLLVTRLLGVVIFLSGPLMAWFTYS